MTATTPLSTVRATPVPANGDVLYEVVDGQVVELPPMGVYENSIATVLVAYLVPFGKTHKLGRAIAETLFLLVAVGNRERRPDVAFVSYQRWPRHRPVPQTSAWEVVPNLAVEVISQTNSADEVQAKLHEYFQAGVQQVWIIYPRQVEVYVYQTPTQVRILTRTDDIDGGDVLPGFRLPVAALFEEETEQPPAQAPRE